MRFFVEQRTEWLCTVLGPNPDAMAYTGDHLLICTTDNREEANRSGSKCLRAR